MHRGRDDKGQKQMEVAGQGVQWAAARHHSSAATAVHVCIQQRPRPCDAKTRRHIIATPSGLAHICHHTERGQHVAPPGRVCCCVLCVRGCEHAPPLPLGARVRA